MGVASINNNDIEVAAKMDNLDHAAKSLQDIAGITTGDVAGICLKPKDWAEASQPARLQMLRQWLKTEANYE